MARYNEILTGRHNRFMQKLFGMKGGPPAPQLSSEIQPVHPLFHGAENRYLESWNKYCGFINVIGAASSPVVRITNDVGSGVIAVLEKISFSLSVAGFVNMVGGGPVVLSSGHVGNLSSPASVPAFDARSSNPPASITGSVLILSSSTTTQPSIGSAVASYAVLAGVTYDYIITDDQELPFPPQSAFQLTGSAAGSTLIVNFQWRERALEESERF